MENLILALRAYTMTADLLTRLLADSGKTLEEVKAAVDEEERKTFDKVEARIAEMKAIVNG
jgi:hypothetical protein